MTSIDGTGDVRSPRAGPKLAPAGRHRRDGGHGVGGGSVEHVRDDQAARGEVVDLRHLGSVTTRAALGSLSVVSTDARRRSQNAIGIEQEHECKS
jgi:hypothetical protein